MECYNYLADTLLFRTQFIHGGGGVGGGGYNSHFPNAKSEPWCHLRVVFFNPSLLITKYCRGKENILKQPLHPHAHCAGPQNIQHESCLAAAAAKKFYFNIYNLKKLIHRTSLAIQWLGLCFHCRGCRFYPWSGNNCLWIHFPSNYFLSKKKFRHFSGYLT